MNKSDLISLISEKADVPIKKAQGAVELVFDLMKEALLKEDRIEIRGFGSFSIRHYESYTGRNPKTGASIQVSPKRLPFFKVGKELKEFVDEHEGSDQAEPSNEPPETPKVG